jgi:NADH:ubiquinone oxidoreductase subunit 6 (subunit J)
VTLNLTPEALLPIASTVLFVGMAATALAGAIVAAASRRLVRSVAGLALSFMGLAGLYYFLHSPFLALMQILIYIGAVCVAIMFALMLADPHDEPRSFRRELLVGAGSFVAAGALATALLALIGSARWMPPPPQPNTGTIQEIGHALLRPYGLAFELISVVLLLAILGALVVARTGRRAKP